MSLNHFKYFKRGIGDRYDGWRIRKVDIIFRVISYFLKSRNDSQNFFEEKIPVEQLEEFIKKHKEEMPDLSVMHVVMAALVRLISQRPQLNRFVVWNKIFARNHFNISIAIKRSLTDDGEETFIKPYFMPEDTLQDVVRKVQMELNTLDEPGVQKDADLIAGILNKLPDLLLRFVVFCLSWLDRVGIMPKFVHKISPWHCSFFLTNMGSIGFEPIYHHLYKFGTCSVFIAMGRKSTEYVMDSSGNIEKKRHIGLKFVVDERICDGFYYASSLRLLNKILANPEQLLSPPQSVIIDEGVGKKRMNTSKK